MSKILPFAIFVALMPFASAFVSAQEAIPQPKKGLVNEFADEPAVVERDEVLYRYNGDGTGSRIETTAMRVQSGAALQMFAVLAFPYASGTQELRIVYARVRKPDGTVIATPTTDAQDQPAPTTQLAPMYSDLHVKQLPLRSLAVGDTLEVETKVTQRQAEVEGEFWGTENFGAGLVYLDRRIELRVPKSKAVMVYSPKDPPEIVESGEDHVYRWRGTQLRRSNAKEEDAPKDKNMPIAWTTFSSWEWGRGTRG